MYVLNKIVGAMTHPVVLGATAFALLLVWALVAQRKRQCTTSRASSGLATALIAIGLWFWLWSTPAMSRLLGVTLEREWLVDGRAPHPADLPPADAIELHGGSMGFATSADIQSEMWYSADRVRMAAQLWKLGKAPRIFVTGTSYSTSTLSLLQDFGVPTNAIITADSIRNTEEEVRFVAQTLAPSGDTRAKPRVLVVTSAWHLSRTMLLYAKYAPDIVAVAAPCDFENSAHYEAPFDWHYLLPVDEALVLNRASLHEWIGILGYRWFRK